MKLPTLILGLITAILPLARGQNIDNLPSLTGSNADAFHDFLMIRDASVSAGAGALRQMTLAEAMKTPALFSSNSAAIRPQLGVHLYLPEDYGGSGGDGTQTTGSVTASSATLTVANGTTFDVGEGIYIAGAGTSGARFVATVTARNGNTITLSSTAATTVSGAVVQHDDSAAINAAIAAALEGGGGTIYLKNGHWRCNGPFDGTTDSILTVPPAGNYTGTPIYIGLVGESPGTLDADYEEYVGGTCIDSSDSPGANTKHLFAPHRYIGSPSFENLNAEWSAIEFRTDKLLYLVMSNPTINGLMLANTLRADIGNQVRVIAKAVDGAWVEPTGSTGGIAMPLALNNIASRTGAAQVVGFQYGIGIGEHQILDRSVIGFCKVGLNVSGVAGGHAIVGTASTENCNIMLAVSGGCTLDLNLQMEGGAADKWYKVTPGNCIYDPASSARGRIHYSMFDHAASLGPNIGVSGGTGLIYDNLRIIKNVVMATGNGTDQTIATGTAAVVKFETESWDPAGVLASAAAGNPSRYTPTVQGWYQVSCSVQLPALPAGAAATLAVRQNGSSVMPLATQRNGASATDISLCGTKLIYFNGTSDYLDFVVSHDKGTDATLAGSALLRSMDIRPATIPGQP
jgi:hypothetical protein